MPDSARIRELNDAFRQSFCGNQVVITRGIAELPNVVAVLSQVRAYNNWTAHDDVYEEHDFGSLIIGDTKVFWKIDYYNSDLTAGSDDPANPQITQRVLTVMLSSEY